MKTLLTVIDGTFGDDVRGGDGVVFMEVDKVAEMLVKIPDEYYWCDWQLVLLMEVMLDVVMDMEVDKLANIMVNMEVDKVADEVADMEIDWQVAKHGGRDD